VSQAGPRERLAGAGPRGVQAGGPGRRGRAAPDRIIGALFFAFSFALAFWQRPGWATSDTKIDLHVDPVQFLHQVASVWTTTTDLGEVHSAQYSGYLWPMGPFFAAAHSIGLGAWVVQRLWLGLMFALVVWGILRLLDVLIGRPRGVVHVVAGGFYLLNPYTVVFTARTSITLLGYAALPWLLLVTYHGVRAASGEEPPPQRPQGRAALTTRLKAVRWRAWWWAAAFALILTSTGGGVNAAVVGWMLVGPLVLLIYEPAIGNVRWRAAWRFLVRVGILSLLASLWWIVPLLVHVRYGIDFLQFTEQPATIWGTNSSTESLRLMGYWTSYIGVGFGIQRPFFSDGATLLFNPAVVGASLLLPGLALAGFVRARRLSYAPFLLSLVVVGAVIMVGGFPDGTPLRGAMDWVYHHIFVLRFMRTTNKAAPLVAVGLAGLLGLGARQALSQLRRLRGIGRRRAAILTAAAGLAALIVLAALPLIRGGALDTQLSWKRIPAPWVNAGHGLDRQLPENSRAIVLPGQIFAYYNWGGTLDAILPRLTTRPVAVRYETPYSDLHAVDLLTTVDDLVQQRRLVPGELTPLLALMGVQAVVTGTDDDISRSGAMAPAAAAGVLAGQGLATPARSYGPLQQHPPASGDVGAGVRLPEVRRYDISPGRGIVHVDPAGPSTIVDGGAQTLADMGAFGRLPSRSPIFYAGDLTARALRAQAASGAEIVVGDSNRRRQFLPESTQQNLGVTLGASDPIAAGAAVINPFPRGGTDAQTVSVLRGARYLNAPTEPGELQFPEHAPIAAFDGDTSTSWIADRNLPVFDRWIEVGFNAPRDVPYVDLNPLGDTHGVVTEIDVNGVHQSIHPGWNRIPVHPSAVTRLRVTIDDVVQPKHGLGGPGGFKEIRIPGFHVQQLLRAPIVVGRQLAGADLGHDGLSYVFERTTGDDPFKRQPFSGTTVLDDPKVRGDPEAQIDRLVFAPAGRTYSLQAWVYPAVGTRDATLDRLAGYRGPVTADSSGRFQDQPAYRASSAFGRPGGAGWIGVWQRPPAPAPWISWTTAKTQRISRLRLKPSVLVVRRPTLVRLSWARGASPPLPVGADGSVVLPHPVLGRAFRLTILGASFPAGATLRQRESLAVGIGSLSVRALKQVRIPESRPLRAPCGTVRAAVGARTVPLAVRGTVAQLDAGVPLQASSCGAAATVPMSAGVQELRSLPGPFSVDLLRLSSPAPRPVSAAPSGTVLDPGKIGNSSVTGVRVALSRPSWLVLGESYDAGWRASCDGRSLGAPQVIDGYGNGWLAPAGCSRVTFSFAPQDGVKTSYAVSAVVCALLLLFLLSGAFRAPALASVRAAGRVLPDPTSAPRSLPRAAALALMLALPIGFVFAIRAGAASFPLLTFVLWRGYGPRTLAAAAAVLFAVVVPIVYAITQPRNRGGYSFAYATDLIAAHWIGVTVIVLCAMTVWMIVTTRPR
jgi:arabinofuranan 3-O-arabinosyltransferase